MPGGGSACAFDAPRRIGENQVRFGSKTHTGIAGPEQVLVAPVRGHLTPGEQARSRQKDRAGIGRVDCAAHLVPLPDPAQQLRVAAFRWSSVASQSSGRMTISESRFSSRPTCGSTGIPLPHQSGPRESDTTQCPIRGRRASAPTSYCHWLSGAMSTSSMPLSADSAVSGTVIICASTAE